MKKLSSILLIILTALLMSCEKPENSCRKITKKYKVTFGYFYDDGFTKEYIKEGELYFFILENNETKRVTIEEYDSKSTDDCYE